MTEPLGQSLTEYQRKTDAQLSEHILRVKGERDVVILAHNYQRLAIQQVADIRGDSLALAREASRAQAGTIIFCGVHFMAETAKILNPERRVLIPEPMAGCPMAGMITAESLRQAKRDHPDAAVVTYVNSTAAVKAQSDICCTSSNAVEIVRAMGDREILFVPDRNLGSWVKSKTGARIILWEGWCHVHNEMTAAQVRQAREKWPQAKVVVHPETPPEVTALADYVTSTAGMIRLVATTIDDYIIGTEIGLVDALAAEFPDRNLYALTADAICPNMKLTTLAKLAYSLDHGVYEVTVSEDVRVAAKRALDRMLEVS